MKMQDEAGNDAKVLAVPVSKKLPLYDGWKTPDDAPQSLTRAITHFFEHYKDLEAGKWVKVLGWDGPETAKKEIADGIVLTTGSYLLTFVDLRILVKAAFSLFFN